MEEFNFDNASKFLSECGRKTEKAESARQVVIRLAPMIRELEAGGYTKRDIYGMLAEKYDLKLNFETFRNYLQQAQTQAKKDGE